MSDVLVDLGRSFAALSLVSIGGINALLPEIHRQVVVVHGWMTDIAFASAFAIANASPGPNVILLSLIGWQVAGLPGLLVATLAIMIPSCTLAYFAGRMLGRWSGSGIVALLRDALVPVALGLMLASGVSMMRTVDRDAAAVAISLAAAAFVYLTKRNPLWALTAGALANIAALHLPG